MIRKAGTGGRVGTIVGGVREDGGVSGDELNSLGPEEAKRFLSSTPNAVFGVEAIPCKSRQETARTRILVQARW